MKTLSKILLPLVALLILPALVFLPFLQISMSGSVLSTESLGLEEHNSVYSLAKAAGDEDGQLYSYIKLIKEYSSKGTGSIKSLIPSINWLYAVGVCLVLVLACMLLLIFFSIFSEKRLLHLLFGVVGLLATGLMRTCFNKFAEPLLNGTVSVSSILSSVTASSGSDSSKLTETLSGLSGALSESLGLNLSGLADSLVGFKTLALSFATDAVMLAFVAVIILSIVFAASQKLDTK